MRRAVLTLLLAAWLLPGAAAAVPALAATPGGLLVTDVELVELAPSDQRYDQAEDAARAAMVSRRIRAAIVASGRYRVLDRGPADRQPPDRYPDCKACILDWPRQRGAQRVLVVWVQKESRLILMLNMALIDVSQPRKELAGGSVDLRGDTDETWLAGASQMLERTLGVAMTP